MSDQTPKQVPNMLDLAKTIISALEQQERKNKKVEQANEAQKDLNFTYEKRIRELELVNENLVAKVTTLEREVENITKAYKEMTEKSKTVKEQEIKTDPQKRNDNLEGELRRVFGKRDYITPETLFWIFGR